MKYILIILLMVGCTKKSLIEKSNSKNKPPKSWAETSTGRLEIYTVMRWSKDPNTKMQRFIILKDGRTELQP